MIISYLMHGDVAKVAEDDGVGVAHLVRATDNTGLVVERRGHADTLRRASEAVMVTRRPPYPRAARRRCGRSRELLALDGTVDANLWALGGWLRVSMLSVASVEAGHGSAARGFFKQIYDSLKCRLCSGGREGRSREKWGGYNKRGMVQRLKDGEHGLAIPLSLLPRGGQH